MFFCVVDTSKLLLGNDHLCFCTVAEVHVGEPGRGFGGEVEGGVRAYAATGPGVYLGKNKQLHRKFGIEAYMQISWDDGMDKCTVKEEWCPYTELCVCVW